MAQLHRGSEHLNLEVLHLGQRLIDPQQLDAALPPPIASPLARIATPFTV